VIDTASNVKENEWKTWVGRNKKLAKIGLFGWLLQDKGQAFKGICPSSGIWRVAEKGTGIAAIGDGPSIQAKVPQLTQLYKLPNDDQIGSDSDNDENDNETSTKYRRSLMPPEGSILFHYLEGVKERVRWKGELIDMAKGQKSIPANEGPAAAGLKSRPVPDISFKNVCVEVWAQMEQFKNKCHMYKCPFCHETKV
jgi:hypothetical protein